MSLASLCATVIITLEWLLLGYSKHIRVIHASVFTIKSLLLAHTGCDVLVTMQWIIILPRLSHDQAVMDNYTVHIITWATYRSSSFSIIFFNLMPCDVFHDGLCTWSAEKAPNNQAALMLNSTLWRHLAKEIKTQNLWTGIQWDSSTSVICRCLVFIFITS